MDPMRIPFVKNVPLAGLLILSLCGSISAQSSENCEGPEFRAFDFWVGEWDVTESGKLAGTSSVQLILNDCVVFENWTGVSGYSGKSFNIYSKVLKKWRQFWVDNRGGVLQFTGNYKEGKLLFDGVTPQQDGGTTLERLTFFNLSPNKVRQLWEQSHDGGKKWEVVFDGEYTRKAGTQTNRMAR